MRRGQDPLPIGRRRAGGERQPGRVLRHVVRHRGRRHHHHDGNSNDDTETVAAGPGREKAGYFFGEVEWQSNFIPQITNSNSHCHLIEKQIGGKYLNIQLEIYQTKKSSDNRE